MKTCSQCAEQVQDDAKACRFCGHKFGFQTPKIGCVGFGIIALLGLYIVGQFGSEEAPPSGPAEATTADKILAAYAANEAGAQAYYGSRRVAVTGIVQQVSLNLSNKAVVRLGASRRGDFISAHLDEQSQSLAGGLAQGDEVTLTCNEANEIMGIPVLMDCAIPSPQGTSPGGQTG